MKITNSIELVSLHIPKTAGTSFRNTLKIVYGKNAVVRLDINKKVLNINEKKYTKNKIKSKIKVVHGHFSYKDIYEKLDIDSSVPIITWLRDPVERVISNYYYLLKVLKQRLGEDVESNIGNRMIKTLLEFAHQEANKNRMTKFLKEANLKNFLFVGIVEHYQEDLYYLSKLLDWNTCPVLKQNTTQHQNKHSESIKKVISQLNNDDIALYKEALKIRKERMEKTPW